MATVLIEQAMSQSAKACKSSVNVANFLTGRNGFDARIAQAGELGGFAFPPQNGLDNGQPAGSGNVANDIMQLKVAFGVSFYRCGP